MAADPRDADFLSFRDARGHNADDAAAVLRRAGFAVDALDSGCCGMAGSFGYEAEHYDLSVAIGDILREQVAASDGDVVTAPGASCRTQLADGGDHPPHPIELLADAIVRPGATSTR